MNDGRLESDGFCLLRNALPSKSIVSLLEACRLAFAKDSQGLRARSGKGHVYAARNLIESIPEVTIAWQCTPLLPFLVKQLGSEFGLVRALFFDKPTDRTWALGWHKDTSIAVSDNTIASTAFSRPTTKAGVPHVIACDGVLQEMLTLRIHLDEVTEENGPLRVIPGSHRSSDSGADHLDSAVDIHAAAGDVLAMRPLISHCSGSSKPGTTRHRRILHLEFTASTKLPDGMNRHDFVPAG